MLWYSILFGIQSLLQQFSMEKSASEITWAHAVNDNAFLESSLNSEINMLEADVVIGRLLNRKETEIPIMAHPPNDTSDITLLQFITIVDDFNKKLNSQKGIKLDFKTIESFEAAVKDENFRHIINKATYPVWFNADILRGPLSNSFNIPVDADRFLSGAKLFPNSILSIGWTTGYNTTEKIGYSNKDINDMLNILTSKNITQLVTFPVRAGLVAESIDQMKSLLQNNQHTLTIWSAVHDEGINLSKLNIVIDAIGSNRIFIDVPEKLRNQLKFQKTNSNNAIMA